MNYIGNFIREYRGKISLRDFAEKCNISHTHLDSIEKGIDPRTGKPVKVTVETLKKIANAMNMTINDLLVQSGDVKIDDIIVKKNDFSDNTSKAFFSFTLIELIRYKKMKLKDFSNYLGINADRILDFINRIETPTEEEIEKICNLFDIKEKEELFNGKSYDDFLSKNGGSLFVKIMKSTMGEDAYIDQNNINRIVATILPDNIVLNCNNVDDTFKNTFILQNILFDKGFLKKGKELSDDDIKKIEIFLNGNINYINSQLTPENRSHYKNKND